MAFGRELRPELVTPREDDTLVRLDLADLARIRDLAVRLHDLPGGALSPFAVLPALRPVLLRELRLGQGAPELLRRGANVDHVNEARSVTHHAPPVSFSAR